MWSKDRHFEEENKKTMCRADCYQVIELSIEEGGCWEEDEIVRE